MIITEGTLQFDFTGAIDAFKFDEQSRSLPTYHGLSHCMKAVDLVIEYDDHYLFVEIKNPPTPDRYASNKAKNELINDLTTKFRDTFLYRWAEKKVDKPIHYQCLVELEDAMTAYLMEELKKKLPTANSSRRWQRPLAHYCAVTNRSRWNKTFPNIQISSIEGGLA